MSNQGSKKENTRPSLKRKTQTSGKRYIGRLFVMGFLIAGIYIGMGYVVSVPAFRIQTISLSGNNVIVPADITPIIEQEMEGYSNWPYRKDSIFTFPKKKIKKKLFDTFGRIQKISFNKRGLQEVEVVIEEKDGQYLWCGLIDQMGQENSCYIIDGQGSLFDVAPQISGDAYFKIYGGAVQGEGYDVLGSRIFSLEDFNAIIQIKDELERHDFTPVALLLYDDGLIEFVKKIEGVNLYEGARIKFTLLADYKVSIDNLLSALNSEPLKTEIAEKEELLQYVDVRFDNRVYYKFSE